MQEKEIQRETLLKSIRFEKNLAEKIDKMREGTERNFSRQVQWMLRQYIEIVEKSKQ